MLQEISVSTPETNRKPESLSRETEDMKLNQMEILNLKNITTEDNFTVCS